MFLTFSLHLKYMKSWSINPRPHKTPAKTRYVTVSNASFPNAIKITVAKTPEQASATDFSVLPKPAALFLSFPSGDKRASVP